MRKKILFITLILLAPSLLKVLPFRNDRGWNSLFAQSTRIWATYYGGTGKDNSKGTASDASGNAYLAGRTSSATNIASGGFQNTLAGGADGYLVKFDPAGSRLWATYYGGTDTDYALSVTSDASGNTYLAGESNSTSGIASGGFQNFFSGNMDAFLVKFDPAGTRLWATYYGGTGEDRCAGTATDGSGNVYLAGYTTNSVGIASGGFQNAFGGGSYETYLVKFDPAGSLLWATYYGGTGEEYYSSVATDVFGNVYLAGSTSSASGIASGGFQNTYGGGVDAFLVKFDPAGNRLWATYYGGTGSELYGSGVATDPLGNVYLVGNTTSASNIASGGFQNVYAGGPAYGDVFLVKFDPAGNRLWATYYGGSDNEESVNVATDASGNVYLGADSYSSNGIASGGFQNNLVGIENQFVAKFNSSGNLLCATYYGQNHDEEGHVAVDGAGNIYMGAYTSSTTGIASGGFQNTYGGGNTNAYLVKFGPCLSALNATASSTNTSCYGECTGTATASISGGSPSYTYAWSPAGGANANATGLCAGSYTVTVTDAMGGTTTATASITEPAALSATIGAPTHVTCNALCNGNATVAPGGGTLNYTYSWSTIPVQNTVSATGLCAGSYTATVTDANNCTITQTVTITEPAAITATITSNPAICTSSTGDATVTPSGGTGAFTYSWSPAGGSNANATGLVVGDYTVTITDANGCALTQTVSVSSVNTLSVSASSTSTSCSSATGSATANPGGGSPAYSYNWNNGQTTVTSTGLASGSYTVTVTDANGCALTQTVSVSSVNTLSVSASSTSASCTSATGSATANPGGGSPAYSYNWNNGQTTATSTGLAAGGYTVTVTDVNGCTQSQTVSVTSVNTLSVAASSIQTGCAVDSGTATAIPSAGTSPYTYNWSNGQTTQSSTGLASGSYTVTVTDVNGCTQTQTVSVVAANNPVALVTATPINITMGNNTQLNATGGGTYAWSPVLGLSCITCFNPIATPSQTTTYCVLVTDANGCTDSACITVNVEMPCGNIFIPNAFSPNGDAENELECVLGSCIQKLYFVIYDRWGEKMFETSDQKICWDGTYNGILLNTATFVYYLEATLLSGEQVTKNGNISLIR